MAKATCAVPRRDAGDLPQGLRLFRRAFQPGDRRDTGAQAGHRAIACASRAGHQRYAGAPGARDTCAALPESQNRRDGGAPNQRHCARHAAATRRDEECHDVFRADGSLGANTRSRFGTNAMNPGDFRVAWEIMKWPFAACLILPPLLVYLGLHVVRREVIFVDLALAQVATLGTCVALLLGYHFEDRITFWMSLGVTFLGAAFFSWSRASRKQHVPQEAIIGITFVVAAAGVILLLSRVAGGKEELEHLLTGDILNATKGEIGQRTLLFAVLGGFYAAFHQRFVLISSDPEKAFASGIRVRLWDFLFYAAFALVVVSFVRLAGVLLTFAYLIVPAVCGTMLAQQWMKRLAIGWGVAAAASLLGLWTSYQMDLPTGAAIVCASGVLLAVVSVFAALRRA